MLPFSLSKSENELGGLKRKGKRVDIGFIQQDRKGHNYSQNECEQYKLIQQIMKWDG